MDIRKLTRSALAFLPLLTLCLVSCYALYSMTQIQDADIAQTMKEIGLFSLGGVAGIASSAAAFYFKADSDENGS